jgi:hypothetical protein
MGMYQYTANSTENIFKRLQIENTDVKISGGGLTVDGLAKSEATGKDTYSLVSAAGIDVVNYDKTSKTKITSYGLLIEHGDISATNSLINTKSIEAKSIETQSLLATQGIKITGVLDSNSLNLVSPRTGDKLPNISLYSSSTNGIIYAYRFAGSGYHLIETADGNSVTPKFNGLTLTAPKIEMKNGRPNISAVTTSLTADDI